MLLSKCHNTCKCDDEVVTMRLAYMFCRVQCSYVMSEANDVPIPIQQDVRSKPETAPPVLTSRIYIQTL
jgi:hypothetical protein